MALIRKFAGYSALVTAALAMAVALMLATSAASSAAVSSVVAATTTVDGQDTPGATLASRTSAIQINGTGAGDFRVVATTGTLALPVNSDNLINGGAAGTNDLTVQQGAFTGPPDVQILAAGTIDTDGDGVAGPACTGCYGGYNVLAAGTIDTNGDGAAGPAVLASAGAPFGITILAGGFADADNSGASGGDAFTPVSNIANFTVNWTSPNVNGPGTATISVIQGASVKTVDVKYRGNIDSITLVTRLQTVAGAAGISTTKSTTVIRSTTATAPAGGATNAIAANLRASAVDSANNGLNGVTVVFITTDGSLVDGATLAVATGSSLTATGGNLATGEGTTTRGVTNAVSLVAGTTGLTGDTATVTASAGGKTASVTVKFGGDAVSCTLTASNSSVQSGGSTQVTVTFASDANGTPIPDYNVIAGAGTANNDPNITAVNSVGAGTFAVTGQTAPVGGTMSATLTVGASGGTGVLASMGGTSVTCNTTVNVASTVAPPSAPSGDEGTFDRSIPSVGVNTAVWNGGTVDQLASAVATAGGISVTVFVNGQATVLIPGAPAFVNAAFNAVFSGGTVPAGTIVLVVR